MNGPVPNPHRSFWKKLFLSPGEPRLRAGWRLAIQISLMLVLLISAEFSISLLRVIFHLKISSSTFLTISTLIDLIAFTGSVFLARRFLDRRSFASLGLKLDQHLFFDLLSGILISFVIMGLVFLAMKVLGWIRFEGFAWPSHPPSVILGQTLLFLLIFIFVGWQEELLARGYHLQTIASGANLFWGVLISAFIFGLLHISNPSANWFSVVGIFFAGLFLALGYVRTHQLWLSIGLHIGWNFFEGIVFGFPVSGFATFPLIRVSLSGPALWTGGAFGPEAGLILLPALLIGALLIIVYTSWRDRSIHPGNPTRN